MKTAKEPLFWVQNEPVDSIWQPGEERPYLARHLLDPIRVVMGFWAHQGVSVAEMAAAAGLFPGEYIALNRMLLASEQGVILFCKQWGLPASASVKLKTSFRCKCCLGKLSHLPCIRCWNSSDDDPCVD